MCWALCPADQLDQSSGGKAACDFHPKGSSCACPSCVLSHSLWFVSLARPQQSVPCVMLISTTNYPHNCVDSVLPSPPLCPWAHPIWVAMQFLPRHVLPSPFNSFSLLCSHIVPTLAIVCLNIQTIVCVCMCFGLDLVLFYASLDTFGRKLLLFPNLYYF